MKRPAIIGMFVLGVSVAWAETPDRFEQLPVSTEHPPAEAVGAGNWQSQRDGLGNRDWQVQIKRFDDDVIEGALIVVGSPQFDKVRLEGRVDGGEVYGALVNDSNQQVGTFTGAIFEGGVSGTYTTADGDTGNWNWAGPAGARTLKREANPPLSEAPTPD